MALPDFNFGNRRICTYCGDPPSGIDHCMSPVAAEATQKRRNTKRGYGPTTPACSWCNSTLSSRRFDSFYRRCEFIHERLERLATPILWSKHEIRNLDYSLQRYVQRCQDRLKWLRHRADWFLGREFAINVDALTWIPALQAHHPKFNSEAFAYFASTISYCLEFSRWNFNH